MAELVQCSERIPLGQRWGLSCAFRAWFQGHHPCVPYKCAVACAWSLEIGLTSTEWHWCNLQHRTIRILMWGFPVLTSLSLLKASYVFPANSSLWLLMGSCSNTIPKEINMTAYNIITMFWQNKEKQPTSQLELNGNRLMAPAVLTSNKPTVPSPAPVTETPEFW